MRTKPQRVYFHSDPYLCSMPKTTDTAPPVRNKITPNSPQTLYQWQADIIKLCSQEHNNVCRAER